MTAPIKPPTRDDLRRSFAVTSGHKQAVPDGVNAAFEEGVAALVQAELDRIADAIEAEFDPDKPWSLFDVTVFLRDATLRNGEDR